MDFNTPHTVGERIEDPMPMLQMGSGYDHNYILNKGKNSGELIFGASVTSQFQAVIWNVLLLSRPYSFIRVISFRVQLEKGQSLHAPEWPLSGDPALS
ncbi:MAG: hypothetical protein MZV63_05945 [Marinilabiliales bacterium]|nr:hypothetical protein [Marinilabiliales bacterium]